MLRAWASNPAADSTAISPRTSRLSSYLTWKRSEGFFSLLVLPKNWMARIGCSKLYDTIIHLLFFWRVREMLPKSFSMSHAVKCFYVTESEIWDGLGWFGSLEFIDVLYCSELFWVHLKPFAMLFSLKQPWAYVQINKVDKNDIVKIWFCLMNIQFFENSMLAYMCLFWIALIKVAHHATYIKLLWMLLRCHLAWQKYFFFYTWVMHGLGLRNTYLDQFIYARIGMTVIY